MADYSEAEMIADFLVGAERAFNWVYKSYYKKLFVFCYSLTQNTQEQVVVGTVISTGPEEALAQRVLQSLEPFSCP